MSTYTLETRPGQPGYVYATRDDGQVFEIYLQYRSIEPMVEGQARMTDPTERAALIAAAMDYQAPTAPAQAPRDTSRDLPDVSAQMRKAGFETDETVEPRQIGAEGFVAHATALALDADDHAAMATSADWLQTAMHATHTTGATETVVSYRDLDGASFHPTRTAQTVEAHTVTRRRVTTTYPDGTVAEGWETLSETTAPYERGA